MSSNPNSYHFEGYRYDVDQGVLFRGNDRVDATPKSLEILKLLIENSGRVVSKEELLRQVWPDSFVEEANLSHHIFNLRKAIGEKLIETVPKRGYRFVGKLETSGGPTPGPEALPRSRVWFIAPIAVLILAAIFGAWLLLSRRTEPDPPVPPEAIRAIAVLPFVNESGSEDVEYLADGMTETLISNLSQVSGLAIKPRSAVFRYKGKDVSAAQIGSEMNVNAILQGRITQRGQDLTLFLSLVDTSSEYQLWGKQYVRKLSDLAALQSEIGRDVSQSLQQRLSGSGLRSTHSQNPEAYRQYLLGNFYWKKFTEEGVRMAITSYERAIELDPNYALAYAGLANSYSVLGVNGHMPVREAEPHVRVASERSVALDDKSAAAHLSFGAYKMFYQWDLLGAELEYKRSMELDPTYPTAPELYSYVLQALRRFDEAEFYAKRARDLDPITLLTAENLGTIYRHAGRLDESLAVFETVIGMDPSFADARFERALTLSLLGRHEDAEAEAKRAVDMTNEATHMVAGLGIVYARAGKEREALLLIDGLVKNSPTKHVSPLDVALIYSVLDDRDKAFEWLEKSYAERSGWLYELNVNPDWDNIRSDERFQDLVRRVGLSHLD